AAAAVVMLSGSGVMSVAIVLLSGMGGRLTYCGLACTLGRVRTSGGTPEPNAETGESGHPDVANTGRRRSLGHVAREVRERFSGRRGIHVPPDAMGPEVTRPHGQLVAQRTVERLEGGEHDAALALAVSVLQQE